MEPDRHLQRADRVATRCTVQCARGHGRDPPPRNDPSDRSLPNETREVVRVSTTRTNPAKGSSGHTTRDKRPPEKDLGQHMQTLHQPNLEHPGATPILMGRTRVPVIKAHESLSQDQRGRVSTDHHLLDYPHQPW
ncbi:hypothetical protein RND81_08G117100 [Saponaria officinalis]|uniref:Uncharacterized protein n=1 Tax=Saponaria officinalis TaxID=3572 RepID=A0AAW1J6Z2_SAPOF